MGCGILGTTNLLQKLKAVLRRPPPLSSPPLPPHLDTGRMLGLYEVKFSAAEPARPLLRCLPLQYESDGAVGRGEGAEAIHELRDKRLRPASHENLLRLQTDRSNGMVIR